MHVHERCVRLSESTQVNTKTRMKTNDSSPHIWGGGCEESGGATANACHQYSPVFTSVNRAGYFAVI